MRVLIAILCLSGFSCSLNATNASLRFPGTRLWAFHATNLITAPKVVGADGTIYVPVRGNYLFALNPDGSQFALSPGGTKLWSLSFSEGLATAPTLSSDGVLYIGGRRSVAGAKLYAVKIASGPLIHPWPMFGHDAQHTSRADQCHLKPPLILANGSLGVAFEVEPHRRYTLQRSSDLVTWFDWLDFVTTNSVHEVSDPAAPGVRQRFYRLVRP